MYKLLITSLILVVSINLSAQISFKTNDVELETDLNTINAKAKLDFGKFKVDIAGSYDIDEKKIEYMSVELSMEPAEIYLALEIGKLSHKSIDNVLEVYTLHKDKGWGYIAKKMGIKPGSEEFHQLKNSTKSNSSEPASSNKNKNKGKGKGKNK